MRKLHKQFAHPSAVKLYDLLKASGINAVTPRTLEKLEYISFTCEPCQKIRTAPKRYRVTIGVDNTHLNAKVYIDFMYIEGVPLLHMIDDATHFSAAQFIEPLATESVWETILTLWETV